MQAPAAELFAVRCGAVRCGAVRCADELDAIADSLNGRPRATHNWRTPLEVFAQTLASAHQPPGLSAACVVMQTPRSVRH